MILVQLNRIVQLVTLDRFTPDCLNWLHAHVRACTSTRATRVRPLVSNGGGRNGIGRREKWPKKSWGEGEIGGKSREEGEIGSESREKREVILSYLILFTPLQYKTLNAIG